MGQLFQTICRLVAEGNYVLGLHAIERLEHRKIMEWQVVRLSRPPANTSNDTIPSRFRQSRLWNSFRMA